MRLLHSCNYINFSIKRLLLEKVTEWLMPPREGAYFTKHQHKQKRFVFSVVSLVQREGKQGRRGGIEKRSKNRDQGRNVASPSVV